MAAYVLPPEAKPIVELNTTPLIDVMLVLLIMFIITIPLQRHAVKIDVGGGPPVTLEVDPVKNVVGVSSAGTVLWNGAPVNQSTLASHLQRSLQLPREPELHVRPDALAPYPVVDEVLAAAKRAGVTKLGFVGNEAYQRAF